MMPMPGDRELDLSIVRDPKRRFTIYLVLPGFGETVFGPLLRVILQRLLAEAQRTLREDKILVLLDEIGNIPNGVPILPSIYGRARGAGLCVWPMFQTLGQVRKDYGESFADFEGNSTVLQFLGTADHQTAKYLSDKLGRHERKQESTSCSSTSSAQGWSSTRNTTTSWVTEAALDAAEIEQAAQRVIGNFMFGDGRGGKLYWSAAMDYWATPMFNGLYRPLPNKPLAPPAGPRPAMDVDRFIQWREANRS
jgi:type IV secretory pathway TraG/TraD family ATPase VirD4